MKRDDLIYWTTTGFIAALMLWSAYNFAFVEEQKAAFQHLLLPNWFRLELTTAKFLGAAVLLLPVHALIKEFAYFGFGLTIVSAEIAHQAVGDPLWYTVLHLVFLGILITSYIFFRKREKHI